ncbi:MAG: alpha-1,2-fucosyltransferase [Flavobacteriales bacterium]|nr:alpha-1,2-fucosyltransferase [Flavobacteriales bacterium]
MIIVKIFQGPGNQLFQYAYGLAASKRIGTELKLDLSWFNDNSDHRAYVLDRFNIDVEVATKAEIEYTRTCNGRNIFEYRYNLLRNALAARHRKAVVKEDISYFDAALKQPYENSHIEGYFSSELFFREFEDEVKKQLVFAKKPPAASLQIMEQMNSENAVALSIRRGDFLKYPLHNTCSVEYYQRAIEKMQESIEKPKLFIFSDDMDWVKANMKFDLPYVLVPEMTDHMEHIRLMENCRFHIIPNSTFSWWGAWLSTPKRVVAPQHWLNPDREIHLKEFGKWVETSHTVPESWVRIPNCLEGEQLMHE